MRYSPVSVLAVALFASASPTFAAPQGQMFEFKDPGVDVGVVTAGTEMFSEPDAGGVKVSSLGPEEWTILVSRQATDKWLNVVELSTGKQGWVRSSRLNLHYTTHPTGTTNQQSATRLSHPPQISIQNQSDEKMYLHIGNLEQLAVLPHTIKHLTVPPGIWSYDESAANVIPLMGKRAFIDGDNYTWVFSIGDYEGPAQPKEVSPAEKLQAEHLQEQIALETKELAADTTSLADEQAALTLQNTKLQADLADIQAKRQTTDPHDQTAVKAFNAEVDSTNDESTAYAAAQQKYSDDVASYNALVDRLNASKAWLEQIASSLNGSST